MARILQFTIAIDELRMRLVFGNNWGHVRQFIEDGAIAFANKIAE
jgi:hypothetical protein